MKGLRTYGRHNNRCYSKNDGAYGVKNGTDLFDEVAGDLNVSVEKIPWVSSTSDSDSGSGRSKGSGNDLFSYPSDKKGFVDSPLCCALASPELTKKARNKKQTKKNTRKKQNKGKTTENPRKEPAFKAINFDSILDFSLVIEKETKPKELTPPAPKSPPSWMKKSPSPHTPLLLQPSASNKENSEQHSSQRSFRGLLQDSLPSFLGKDASSGQTDSPDLFPSSAESSATSKKSRSISKGSKARKLLFSADVSRITRRSLTSNIPNSSEASTPKPYATSTPVMPESVLKKTWNKTRESSLLSCMNDLRNLTNVTKRKSVVSPDLLKKPRFSRGLNSSRMLNQESRQTSVFVYSLAHSRSRIIKVNDRDGDKENDALSGQHFANLKEDGLISKDKTRSQSRSVLIKSCVDSTVVNAGKDAEEVLKLEALNNRPVVLIHRLSAQMIPSDVISNKQRVLQLCEQTKPLKFFEVLRESQVAKGKKIGEGVYGEVYMYTSDIDEKVSALKIIPIEGKVLVNNEEQKTFELVASEIVIAKNLSLISANNFVKLNRVNCIQDKYPNILLKHWDAYNNKKASMNDRPDMFTTDQFFILFEFADGGVDLEKFVLRDASEAKSVVLQVAHALAVAEGMYEFEHRDLHLGNILIQYSKQKTVEYTVSGKCLSVETSGILVTIIDYTLSRLSTNKYTVHTDLAKDKTLFTGQGDYQFDIYRLMRDHNDNNWEDFRPYTNVLWLHYLLHKILFEKKFQIPLRRHKSLHSSLKEWYQSILSCSSAEEFVLTVSERHNSEQPVRRRLRCRN